jgi:hypothetical protein
MQTYQTTDDQQGTCLALNRQGCLLFRLTLPPEDRTCRLVMSDFLCALLPLLLMRVK